VALGIAGTARSFRLAVRVHTPFPGIADWLERVRGIARGEVDVRVVGPVRAQRARVPWGQGRVRPLALGTSLGHARVSAGTLGAIVFARGAFFLLSNDHVLADEDRAKKGDAVLQPGRADGGRAPEGVVARYERAVRLKKTGTWSTRHSRASRRTSRSMRRACAASASWAPRARSRCGPATAW
jgi:hypothetical protein